MSESQENVPPPSSIDIAKYIVAENKYETTPLTVQKIMYFCYGVYLLHYDKLLCDEHPEAWDYGPVFPEVYHYYKLHGSGAIERERIDISLDADKKNILDRTVSILGDAKGASLIAMTHHKLGAWYKTYRPNVRHNVLPLDLIKDEFNQLTEG